MRITNTIILVNWEVIKLHSQLAPMRIRHYVIVNLHITETLSTLFSTKYCKVIS